MQIDLMNVIFTTLGGLGIFVLGMKMMTDGLQMSAGKRIKTILGAVSSNRVIGCLTGTGVTALVQSSSATTVMLIGFVSAGLMTLQQAVGVILGANIGTTVTAQLIAFNLTKIALPAIALGVVMKFFTKQKRYRYAGEVILGFGLLFFGMTVMKSGLSPIKNDPAFLDFFTRFDPSTAQGLLLSVVVGALLTIMVQSSSATIGLTMTLATQGLLTFPGAMALVLGENIGTTITAELATIGSTNVNAHRAARAHTMFNVIGVGLMLLIFPYFIQFIEWVTIITGTGPLSEVSQGDSVNIARYLANGHTLFNVINASIFLVLLPWLIKVAVWLSPREREPEDAFSLPHFEERFIDTPIAAITQARSEILRMAESARAMLQNALEALATRDHKKLNRWKRYEQHLDEMQREITAYLVKIYQSEVSETEAREVSSLMRMTNNLERIGDSLENVSHLTEDMLEGNLQFTPQAQADIRKIGETAAAFVDHLIQGMHTVKPDHMQTAQTLEDDIDDLREAMRDDHVARLRSGDCALDSGLIFIGMLSNFEKIGDYCFNVSEAIVGLK